MRNWFQFKKCATALACAAIASLLSGCAGEAYYSGGYAGPVYYEPGIYGDFYGPDIYVFGHHDHGRYDHYYAHRGHSSRAIAGPHAGGFHPRGGSAAFSGRSVGAGHGSVAVHGGFGGHAGGGHR